MSTPSKQHTHRTPPRAPPGHPPTVSPERGPRKRIGVVLDIDTWRAYRTLVGNGGSMSHDLRTYVRQRVRRAM